MVKVSNYSVHGDIPFAQEYEFYCQNKSQHALSINSNYLCTRFVTVQKQLSIWSILNFRKQSPQLLTNFIVDTLYSLEGTIVRSFGFTLAVDHAVIHMVTCTVNSL